MRVRPGDRHPGVLGEPAQAAGGGVAVHPRPAAVKQAGSADAVSDGPVNGAPDRGRQRDQNNLAALPAHTQYPVAVFFAQVGDVGSGGLEDAQAKQPEHAHQREVARMG